MKIDANLKFGITVASSYLWAVGILCLPFFSLIFEFDGTRSIWPGIVFFYLAYKHSTKIRGEPGLSILSFWYFFVAILASLLAIVELFENGNYIYLLLLAVGVLHFYLSIWTYQNAVVKSPRFPGKDQTVTNYEIINFDKVRELISRVDNGDMAALTSGEYLNEISDAAIQAMSEKILLETVQKCVVTEKLAEVNNPEDETNYATELFRHLINQLDNDSRYQLYPLLAEDENYFEYFFSNNGHLRLTIINSIVEIDSDLTAENLKNDYFQYTPCAEYWPIIAKFIYPKPPSV